MRAAFVGTGDAHLDRYPPGGGIEHQVWILARELSARGHDVEILTRDRDAEISPRLRLVRVPAAGDGHVLPKLPMSRRAARKLAADPPDVLYLSEKWVSYFPSRLPVPKIYAAHNKDAFESYRRLSYRDHPVNRVFFPVKRAIEEGEMRRSHVVAASCPSIREYLVSRGFSHAEVLTLAVDAGEFASAQESDPPFVFASGQLLPVKGTRVLVRAFAKATADYKDWRLVIGGRGPERPALEADARRWGVADRVDFVGWLPRQDYVQLLRRASVFALASFAETFGVVLLEAMASEKPVVATRIPGPADIVLDHETGLLAPPGDADALATALARLMEDADLRRRYGRAGARRAREEYSPQAAAEAYLRCARLAQERHADSPASANRK